MRVIAGTARSVPLKSLEGLSTRPTTDRVKTSLFNIIQFEIAGREVLDLFGGSGALGIEALSRGAGHATFVDQSAEAVAVIRENLQKTKLAGSATVVQSEALSFLRRCKNRYDLIFLDPPYAENLLENALKCISEIDILKSRGIIICERPAEKTDCGVYAGLTASKDYRYGKTVLSLYRKE